MKMDYFKNNPICGIINILTRINLPWNLHLFVTVACCYFTSGITSSFFKRDAYVGTLAHRHTYAHYVDIAQAITIVLAFEWETGKVSRLARSFKKCANGSTRSVNLTLNLSFGLGSVSELTLQSQVTFNYHYDSFSQLACLPGPTWSHSRTEQTWGPKLWHFER